MVCISDCYHYCARYIILYCNKYPWRARWISRQISNGLGIGGILILYYEFTTKWEQMIAIIVLYVILAFEAWKDSNKNEIKGKRT
ncbi:MAG: hypothetical protein DRJ07_05720 [Bacteroidetes bacterium]|nr:MAG: hypothetical protein DRJ07_05720 [Bacteroidota bacterium]